MALIRPAGESAFIICRWPDGQAKDVQDRRIVSAAKSSDLLKTKAFRSPVVRRKKLRTSGHRMRKGSTRPAPGTG